MRSLFAPRLVTNPTPAELAQAMASERNCAKGAQWGETCVGGANSSGGGVMHTLTAQVFRDAGGSVFMAWVPSCCLSGGNLRAFGWKHRDQATPVTCMRCTR